MEAESINFIKLLSLGTRLFNLCNITRYIHKALLHSEVVVISRKTIPVIGWQAE